MVFQQTEGFSLVAWIHNDFMYVRFGGMRNTKTWSKSNVQGFVSPQSLFVKTNRVLSISMLVKMSLCELYQSISGLKDNLFSDMTYLIFNFTSLHFTQDK